MIQGPLHGIGSYNSKNQNKNDYITNNNKNHHTTMFASHVAIARLAPTALNKANLARVTFSTESAPAQKLKAALEQYRQEK